MRTLTIGKDTWHYLIGTSAVVVKGTDGKRKIVGIDAVAGRSHDTIERGRRKKTSDGMVTPQHVRDYIEKHLVGG